MSRKTYGAGQPTFDAFDHPQVGWPDRPRYLMSFAYLDQDQYDLCVANGVDLCMDSGAFTTKTLGKEMDYDAYLDWLVAHGDSVSFAFSLDVIGDHVQSRENHEYALRRVGDAVKMVPVFHFGSPLRELERMCFEYDFIAIGGGAGQSLAPGAMDRVLKEYHRIAARYGTRVHGLGMTGNQLFHRHPWYSVDSTSWLTATRFPLLPLATREGRILQIDHGLPLDGMARSMVRHYGGDPDIMGYPGWSLKDNVGADLALERRLWVMRSGARSFMYLEAAKAAHQPDHPPKVYLSGNSGNPGGAVTMIVDAWKSGTPYPE